MSMQFVTEWVLEDKIKKILENRNATQDDMIICAELQKELEVIKKLKINAIDLRGNIEDVQNRLERQAVYFMTLEEFESMKKKAKRYDIICKLIGEEE